MCKEIENQTPAQSWNTVLELVGFFHTFTPKEILANDEKFKFWQRYFLESKEADSVEFRKEFLRIGDMVNALAGLAHKYSEPQIKAALELLNTHIQVLSVIESQNTDGHGK